MRILLTVGLVLVWSMPPVVAVQVWNWMTNFQNGVLNYVLTELHVGNYFQHDWYATTFSQLGDGDDADRLGRAPVRRDHASTRRSRRCRASSSRRREIDGARPWRVFLDVTVPVITPVLLILTSLSILWDFGVFTQPYLLIGQAAHPPAQLPDGHLPLRGGLREDRLRPRRRDLDPDAGDGRGDERRLRAHDGADR